MVFGIGRKKKTTKKRTVKRKVTKKKTAKRKSAKKGKAFGGYMIRPNADLAKIIGNKPVSPSEMTKNIWTYIKRRKLAGR
ncbi:MAG: SWIB/MDM2 domain-containing protein [Candidatus Aenigmatarchaeota archaeon]